ncbi:DNA methyltransferase [Methylobacterium sp. CM6244]
MNNRVEHLAEGVTLYLGDCREILPTLGRFDAAVTDPPYGIGESAAKNRTRGNKVAAAKDYGDDAWDEQPAPPETIAWMRENCRWQIIFGGNYFTLPPTSCWLVWDKENTGDFADCELAWTNMPKAVRRLRWMWNGMLRKGREPRFHLTQKPLGVMSWCLDHLPKDVATVCDPFMGSGTTGVACVGKALSFTGIEREPRHFDTACRRIADELSRPRMFAGPAPVTSVQEALL